ncbi:MAG: SDR family NAD(P)-dependent oxidoreductase, partial [Methylovulum sp.]
FVGSKTVCADDDTIADTLMGYAADIMAVQGFGKNDDLFDLGATSFTLVRLVETIQRQYGVAVPIEVFLQEPSIAALAAYIAGQQGIGRACDNPTQPGTSECKPMQTAIALEKTAFVEDAYIRPGIGRTDNALTIAMLGRLLSLLKQGRYKDAPKYLYASAGGLNPVQTYLYVKDNAVQGLAGGIYYYHPVEHQLYPLSAGTGIAASAFFDDDRALFDDAGFALFFIAQLAAINPIYKALGPVLSVLEAGYIGQLLSSRQAEFKLALMPVSVVDFDSISAGFQLDSSHQFVHCLLGGGADFQNEQAHRTRPNIPAHGLPGKTGALVNVPGAEGGFPTQQERDALHHQQAHLRDVKQGAVKLAELPAEEIRYLLRAAKRDYLDSPVPAGALGRFLCLLRPEQARYLYPSITGTHGIKYYLYITAHGVDGIDEGIYRYEPESHELYRIAPTLSENLKHCYTPFNRKHAGSAKFALFLIAPAQQNMHTALLESGYIGQLLLDRQAEFELGVCPIGGLLFDKIRADFKLAPGDELLHSFVGGSVKLAMPADWPYLEAGRRIQASGAEVPGKARQDIAIIGISGRYPGAETLQEYADNLQQGKSTISRLSFARAGQYRNRAAHPADEFSHIGGFLDAIDTFDAQLFRITPMEAKTLDPQERILLERVWECLENAGYTAEGLKHHRVGVFIGVMWDDYQHHGSDDWQDQSRMPASSVRSSIANRISYFFDFNGPSISFDTSCSSAMTALHYACTSIKNGECDVAIVGGINIMSHPYHQGLLHTLDLLSKDGECHPFGSAANGWVAGEGVGVVLLKARAEAELHRDAIHGLINGTGISHSGRTVRYGAPNSAAQQASITRTLNDAAIAPSAINYIEAAAPGASLADASEIAAIGEVFRQAGDTIYIGSVKANIGHLESASAMSQLTKVLLQMQRRQIFPTLGSRPRNPLLQLDGSGLAIVEQLTPWQHGGPRRALINALGATGSGGHVIVEEYIDQDSSEDITPSLIVLSAATGPQLMELAKRLYTFLSDAGVTLPRLADIAYTLRVGRVEMAERLAVIADNHEDLQNKLAAWLDGAKDIPGLFRGRAALVYTQVCRNTSFRQGLPESSRREVSLWAGTSSESSTCASDKLPSMALDSGIPAGMTAPCNPVGFVYNNEERADVEDASGREPGQLGLPEIAERWVSGARFLWSGLNHNNGKRVPLPTYPFAKEKHWIAERPEKRPTVQNTGSLSQAGVEAYLKAVFSEASEIPVTQLHAEATFDRYGISSYLIKQLNIRLEQDFGELSKTLFFEYQTLRDLAAYFLEHHDYRLAQILGFTAPEAGSPTEPTDAVKAAAAPVKTDPVADEAIAIIGLSGRYPKANNIEAFWENLKNGVDCITEIPAERWDYRDYESQSRWGGFIDDVDCFDPLFFNISPREAETMDPQERLFLETVWETIEDAGYNRESLRQAFGGKIGVFVGVMYGEYQLHSMAMDKDSRAVGSVYGAIANRISYVLDFHGPSMAIDTLCSSSLTALHQAVVSVRRGECAAAIVGGVNLSLHPNKYRLHAQLAMSAGDGRCRSFGAGGDGFVPGEGIGAVLIKPVREAVNDGDHIYAVVKATAINHDGKTYGYTVPNPNAQADMILAALAEARIDPRAISYVEAHGTGTVLGDPVEITGLNKAFGRTADAAQYCALGSVKSNIGHLEAAAGIAGLTKILLQLKHRQRVPSLHSAQTNPNINFADSPFYIPQTLESWPKPQIDGTAHPRLACISSFGAGGANAHAVIAEYNDAESRDAVAGDEPQLVILSAKQPDRLKIQAEALLSTISGESWKSDSRNTLRNLAYTLQVGREDMEERLALIAASLDELKQKLAGYVEGRSDGAVYRNRVNTGDDRPAAKTGGMTAAELLDSWLDGQGIDWREFYQGVKPQRVSLPAYPFAKERYWLTDRSKAAPACRLQTPEPTAQTLMRGATVTPGGHIEQRVTEDLQALVGSVLKIPVDRLNTRSNLADFGFESVSLAEFAQLLGRHYRLEISPALFFRHASLAKLAQYFLAEHGDTMQAFYQTAPATVQRPVQAAQPAPKSILSAPSNAEYRHDEAIAIIGISGRFPNARTVDELWRILAAGEDTVTEIPGERFNWRDYYGDPVQDVSKTNCKWSAFVPGVGEFDPLFFEISPKDAENMDPQQRLLLQEAWNALEDAGFGAAQLERQTVGMFVGVEDGDYQRLVTHPGVTSNHNGVLAARLAYFLDLDGPVMAVNTACSSALVAVHLACQSLRNGECDTAIAAGVNLMLTPERYISMAQAGMSSADGKCYAFDKRANGMVPGEAACAIVLKPLAKALADGDPVHALINGSGINHDGRTNGMTAPNGAAQSKLLARVYRQAHIDPADIDYIVTHGTGTALGDAVEINALFEVFKESTEKQAYCALTSTKGNFGHSFAASGLVSLISMVQAMRHQQIPASLYCEDENDYIEWRHSPFYVNKQLTPWPGRDGKPRTGAVSAFGMSGTNAHVVVQDYAQHTEQPESAPFYLLALSAKTEAALTAKIGALIGVLQQPGLDGLAAISHTLLDGRHHFQYRYAAVVHDLSDALTVLMQATGRKHGNCFHGKVPRDFTGQKAIQQCVTHLLQQSLELRESPDTYRDILSALADFYCQGYTIAGAGLYRDAPPRRIGLPTYPFAAEHYWVAGGAETPVMPSGDVQVPKQEMPADAVLLFAEDWQETPQGARQAEAIKTLVCLVSDVAQQQAVTATLAPQTRLIFIVEGGAYKKESSSLYRAPSTDKAALIQAFSAIREDYAEIDALLYCRAFESDVAPIVTMLQAMIASKITVRRVLLAARYHTELERCYLESWLGFERSSRMALPADTQLALAILDDAEARPVNSVAWQSFISVSATKGVRRARRARLDVSSRFECIRRARRALRIKSMRKWLPVLWDELHAQKFESVLYRRQKRYSCRIRAVAPPENTGYSPIRTGGTYLITGGCGGLGLIFAEHLAKTYKAQLILTGRSPLDERKQAQIAALQRYGSSVVYLQADVADAGAMAQGLRSVRQDVGAIHGVIHAAGIIGSDSLAGKTVADFEQVIAPKIAGTLALDQALANETLDFICYFSSSAAILGDFGSCDYALANRFLMAYARHRNAVSAQGAGKAVVINWPLWRSDGMGLASDEETRFYLKASGQRLLEAEEGVALFERLLSGAESQYLALAGQAERIHQFLGLTQAPVAGEARPKRPPELKGLTIPQCVNLDLKALIAGQLKIGSDQLDDHANLTDFGFDSISLAEFARLLSRHYRVDITPALFFGHSTIEQLSRYFLEQQAEAVHNRY